MISTEIGKITQNTYDARGNLKQTIDPLGNTTAYTYFPGGLPATVTDARLNTTAFAYDANGNLTQQTDALNHTTSYGYDANNNKTSQTVTRTRADGTTEQLTTTFAYDGNGRLTKTTYPDGTFTQTTYNAIGKPDTTTDARGTGTTVNNYLFAGEQFDPALGIYYNRARYYDQRQGRFWTTDTFEGDPQSPASLHKYLYANASAVDRVDPTGNESIAEAEETLADQLTLAARASLNVLKVYNRTKTVLEFVNMARELVSAWHSAGLQKEISDLIRKARSEWTGMTTEAVTNDLEANLPRIIEGVVLWWPGKLLAEHGRPPDAFGIDLPVPFPMAKIALPIGKLPDTSLKGYVIFGAGGSRWGRVTGVEVQYAGEWEQVWRMDFHGAHDLGGKDLDNWSSTIFHYHILE